MTTMAHSLNATWRTTPDHPPVLPEEEQSWKHPFGEACPHGRHIMLVDGTHVRNKFDSDFSQGGNGYAYDFVPKDEIWIDEQIDPIEWPFIAFHECEEADLMEKGMPYDKAHDKVKYAEDIFRRKLMKGR
jgi:hypothetical protein